MKVYGSWKDGKNIYKDKKGYYIIQLKHEKEYLPNTWKPINGNIFNSKKNKTKKSKRRVQFNLTKNQTKYYYVDKDEKKGRRKICRTNKNKKRIRKNKTMKGGNLVGRIVHSVQNITKPLMNNPEPVIGGQENPINPDPTKGHMISNESQDMTSSINNIEHEYISKI